MIGYAPNIQSKQVVPLTRDLLENAMRSHFVTSTCADIADALEKVKRGEMSRDDFNEFKNRAKRRLPIITPHATFKDGHRVIAQAVPSGLAMADFDHIEGSPRQLYFDHIKGREAELGILLVHVTPSCEGLHVIFRRPAEGCILQAQLWMGKKVGLEVDRGCYDLARAAYLVPQDYILYLSGHLFDSSHEPLSLSADDQVLYRSLSGEAAAGNAHAQKPSTPLPIGEGQGPTHLPPYNPDAAIDGIAYYDIIQEWLRQDTANAHKYTLQNGCLQPKQGYRANTVQRLASELRTICDDSMERVLQVIPRWGLGDKEFADNVQGGFRYPARTSSSMDKAVSTLFKTRQSEASHTDQQNRSLSSLLSPLSSSPLPPALPRRLPPLIKLLTSRTPDVYKAAVATAVFPPLGAHLWQTRFPYIDNVEHEATFMNVLMAGTGAGKDCISEPINRIMADIRQRDALNLKREREWKNEVNSRGANKDKRQRPEGLVIQEIDADMTNPAFVMRMAEAEGHFLYTKMNEIQQLDALRGSGRGGQQFTIMCLAFDPGNRYGQTRVGTQSVTEKVTIRFNFNASTTIRKGQQYFSRVLTDGPISRLNFSTIPEREIGAPMPVYGSYGADFDEELRPYIERLCEARGRIDCPEALRLAQRMQREQADLARISQDRTYENLSFRALVIAYLKACVLYVAQGRQWDKTIEAFVRWSLDYDMWCKMQFFAEAIEQEEHTTQKGSRRGPANLLLELPTQFTLDDVAALRRQHGMPADSRSVKNLVCAWKSRKYVEVLTDDNYSFRKLKFKNK